MGPSWSVPLICQKVFTKSFVSWLGVQLYSKIPGGVLVVVVRRVLLRRSVALMRVSCAPKNCARKRRGVVLRKKRRVLFCGRRRTARRENTCSSPVLACVGVWNVWKELVLILSSS